MNRAAFALSVVLLLSPGPALAAFASLDRAEFTGFKARVDLALPTSDGSASAQAVQLFAAYPKLTDAPAAAVDSLTLRSAFSMVTRWDLLFVRADLGLDFNFPQTEGDWLADAFGPRSGFASFLRLNIAGGVQLEDLAFTAEVVNVVVLREHAAGHKSVLSAMTLAAHMTWEPLRFHAGLVVPLARAEEIDVLGVSLGLDLVF